MDEKQIRKALEMEVINEDIKKYVKIREIFNDTNVNLATNKDFQKAHNGLFKIRQRPEMFYKDYYSFMEKHKNNIPSFSDTLDNLYEYGGLESSFSSKLLHTIDPELPIWDQHILRHFYPIQDKYIFEYLDYNFTIKKYDKETRIRYANNVYEDLKIKYIKFLETEKSKEWIKIFEEYYPKDITPIKKVDFIIWQTRESVKSKKKTRG
jgi:hypothetical protein